MKVAIFSTMDRRPTQLLKGDGSALFFALLQLDTELFTIKVLDDTIYSDVEYPNQLPTLDELELLSVRKDPDQDHDSDGQEIDRAPKRVRAAKHETGRSAGKQSGSRRKH